MLRRGVTHQEVAVLSTMMDVPLTVAGLMRYGTTVYGDSEVVTCTADGVRRQSYAQTGVRAAQLAGALRKRGIPDEVAAEVLGRFEDVGLIDDAAFARAWVESRHYSRGLAGRALSAELKQRGVAADAIRAAIDEQLSPDAEASAARRLIERKLTATRGLPPEQRTRRLAGLLARKGYPAGLAFRVIREALESEGDLAFPEDEPPFDEDDPDTE